jgi:glucose/arabinose dehydrogenase
MAVGSSEPLEYRPQVLLVDGVQRQVIIPAGYSLELLTAALDGPRMLSFGDDGELFIGSKSGNVYRLLPPYTRPQIMVRLGDYPHSVAIRDGEMLIARTDGLYRAPYRRGQTNVPRETVTLLAPLPSGGGHNSRTVAVGPDKRVYLSLGISGNCSDQYLDDSYRFEDRRGGVQVLREEAGRTEWKPYASGLRNPVGFDWHPATKTLYATNNGPDHWGFSLPPEYFSRLTPGSFHGMPWFQYNGREIVRDRCITGRPPRPQDEVTPPVVTFPARNAPLGMAFVPLSAMDRRLRGDAVIALHGSWGTRPSGSSFGDKSTRREPALVVVRFNDEGEAQRVDGLITGFQLPDGSRWARPAGVAIGPDGAVYFTSDSGSNALFRLKPENRVY